VFDSCRERYLFPRNPISTVKEALSLRVNSPVREVGYLLISSVHVNYAWSYVLTPHIVFVALCLITWHHVQTDSRQKLTDQKVDPVLVS
jgi:hypothetical protein